MAVRHGANLRSCVSRLKPRVQEAKWPATLQLPVLSASTVEALRLIDAPFSPRQACNTLEYVGMAQAEIYLQSIWCSAYLRHRAVYTNGKSFL